MTLAAQEIGVGRRGWLSIGFTRSSMYSVLPPALKRFHKAYPQVELKLFEMLTAGSGPSARRTQNAAYSQSRRYAADSLSEAIQASGLGLPAHAFLSTIASGAHTTKRDDGAARRCMAGASMTAFDEAATMRKVYGRLIRMLFAMMFVNYLDRINIGFAALDMNKQLGFSPAVFGFASSIFFVGYMLLEVPKTAHMYCPFTSGPQSIAIRPERSLRN